MPNSLVPFAHEYYQLGYNLLFVGDFGVGKTQVVLDLQKELDFNLAYYSCSLLDPWTDLVGVPEKVALLGPDGNQRIHPDGQKKGQPMWDLTMVRPHFRIDEADMIFFDELNRAEDKALNAVFELLQFHSINGEKLPRLKCVWAAINPPNNEDGSVSAYHVGELDPALVDRFNVYVDVKPKPSVPYMTRINPATGTPFMSKAVAMALLAWWSDHDKKHIELKDRISPRRLEMIGRMVTDIGDALAVDTFFPPGCIADTDKLRMELTTAINGANSEESKLDRNQGAASSIIYRHQWITDNKEETIKILSSPTCSDETKAKVVKKMSEAPLADWLEFMELAREKAAIPPSVIEGEWAGFSVTKRAEGMTILSSFDQSKYQDLFEVCWGDPPVTTP